MSVEERLLPVRELEVGSTGVDLAGVLDDLLSFVARTRRIDRTLAFHEGYAAGYAAAQEEQDARLRAFSDHAVEMARTTEARRRPGSAYIPRRCAS